MPASGKATITARLEAAVSRRENAGRAERLDAATRARLPTPVRLVPTDRKIRALVLQAARGEAEIPLQPAPAESSRNDFIYPVIQVDGRPYREVKSRFSSKDRAD